MRESIVYSNCQLIVNTWSNLKGCVKIGLVSCILSPLEGNYILLQAGAKQCLCFASTNLNTDMIPS